MKRRSIFAGRCKTGGPHLYSPRWYYLVAFGKAGGSMLHYTITVNKDHSQATAEWDISTDISDAELISNFVLTVEGKTLDTQCSNGNKACHGSAETTLAKPDQDCPVTFAISTNTPEERHGDDVLRGSKVFDDVNFEG